MNDLGYTKPMNYLENIEKEWAKDCRIDDTKLDRAGMIVSELHHKYFRFLNAVKMKLEEKKALKDKLVFLKTDYYLGNLDKETLDEYGWKPNKRRILKAELPVFLDSDQDIIDINLEINELNQCVIFLNDIIKMLHNRSYIINNTIEYRKFLNG